MSFEVIGHRGAAGHAPENTKSSFDLALELGVDAVETDVHLSADGVPVVIHDRAVDRTTDGTGRVADLRSSELKRLDAGSWFDPQYAGEPLLFLDEALEIMAGRAPLVVEIKEERRIDPLFQRLAALLPRRGQCIVSSFSLDTLRRAPEFLDGIPLAWLIPKGRYTLAAALDQVGDLCVGQVCPHAEELDPTWVAGAKAAGYSVRAWGVPRDDPAHMVRVMRHLVRSGADGTTADYPDVMQTTLRAMRTSP